MTDEIWARLLRATRDHDFEPLPDDANTTIRVGDLRALILYHRTAQCSHPAATNPPSS